MHSGAYNFYTDLTLDQTDAKKVKVEDRIDGKTSDMHGLGESIIYS